MRLAWIGLIAVVALAGRDGTLLTGWGVPPDDTYIRACQSQALSVAGAPPVSPRDLFGAATPTDDGRRREPATGSIPPMTGVDGPDAYLAALHVCLRARQL